MKFYPTLTVKIMFFLQTTPLLTLCDKYSIVILACYYTDMLDTQINTCKQQTNASTQELETLYITKLEQDLKELTL